jgi:uncharacterized protein
VSSLTNFLISGEEVFQMIDMQKKCLDLSKHTLPEHPQPLDLSANSLDRFSTDRARSIRSTHSCNVSIKTVLTVTLASVWMIVAGVSPGIAQERKPARTLTASGRGIVTIPTTLSQVRLAIEVQGKTPTNAQTEAAKRSARTIEYLKTQSVEKLQTTGINLNPTYIYPSGGSPKITGYTATNSISFRVATDRAGAILDGAVKNGASRIDGVSFIASDSALSQAQTQALKQATQDAERQADAVLTTLNLKRREVIGIQINSTSSPSPVPMPMQTMAKVADAAPTTPIVGGEQQVEATVTLDIGY